MTGTARSVWGWAELDFDFAATFASQEGGFGSSRGLATRLALHSGSAWVELLKNVHIIRKERAACFTARTPTAVAVAPTIH